MFDVGWFGFEPGEPWFPMWTVLWNVRVFGYHLSMVDEGPPCVGWGKRRALAIGPPLLSVFLNSSVFVGFSLSSLFFFS